VGGPKWWAADGVSHPARIIGTMNEQLCLTPEQSAKWPAVARLDARTRAIGRAGVAAARSVLASHPGPGCARTGDGAISDEQPATRAA